MFDIGFSELMLIMIVGLIVLGPKRMPVAIRTVMGWVATIRGLAANVQNELAQELKLQELKDSIKKAEQMNLSALSPELGKTVEDLKQSAAQMQETLNAAKNDLDKQTAAAEIAKLSDEQVAEIQAKIEQEHQSLQAQADLQNSEKIIPLAAEELSEELPTSALSPAEIAELAETDESGFEIGQPNEAMADYFPPDDDLATPENINTEGKDVAS